MKIELIKVLKILDEKFTLAQKRDNYEMMVLIVDIKKKILFEAELSN